MGKIYTVTVEYAEQDNGEMVIPIPHEVLDEVKWDIFTDIEWHIEGEGENVSIILRKAIPDVEV